MPLPDVADSSKNRSFKRLLSVFFPQVLCRFYNVSHFPCGAFFVIYAAIGETAEAAVGIEEYLFWSIIFERSFRISDYRLDALDLLSPRIGNAETDLAI
jgi:hypothetical protein